MVCSSEYDAAVEKYVQKWERFQSTYHDMPKAKELSRKMEALNQIKGEGMCLCMGVIQ